VPRRLLLLLALAALVLAAAVAGVLALRGGDDASAEPPADVEARLARCEDQLSNDAKDACYAITLSALVSAEDDPLPVLQRIADESWRIVGYLLPSCHGLMHTVGREYAREHGVTLANLMEYLPHSNDPGCSAGFAHGLVTGVAPQIDVRDPRGSAAVCGEAETRFQRYSCVHGFGHAFMRLHDDDLAPALALCRALGDQAPDCAQGAYHDYWFGVIGRDDAARPPDAVTDPAELCGAQPEEFVRPCWYRAFIDSRPAGFQVGQAEEFEALCGRLDGLQRAACITAASVIGPTQPVEQLALCARLPEADAAECVRGTKVQNLLGQPLDTFVDLADRCEELPGGSVDACYRWLGKVVTVLTDGRFETEGCPRLAGPGPREACVEGARSADEALVTFS
jgi:hypothetical protein